MCGICGFSGDIDFDKEAVLKRMNDSIVHRGPDEDGVFIDGEVGLAMRRLSILDLEHGSQPIFNASKNVCTVYNGEIYNYPELREELESKGYQFQTHVDTEVIVYLYEEYGEDFVKHLRGMFALAVWDASERKLILARDQVGIKPLFYSFANGQLFFGSEIKALIASSQLSLSICHQAIDSYLTFMFIPAPLTIYEEVKKLEPGHLLVFKDGSLDKKCYWRLDVPEKKIDSHISQTENVIQDSIRKHLQSDVPMGVFVSGGIDSSLVAALASKYLKYSLSAFTVFFKGKDNFLDDERPYVVELSKQYPLDVYELECDQDFLSIADEIVNSFDEPFADDSVIPNYYICKLTSEKVKVALSGLGGDELFAGYRRHNGIRVASWVRSVPAPLFRLASKLVKNLPEPKSGAEKVDHIKRFFRHMSGDLGATYFGFLSSIDEGDKDKLYSPLLRSKVDHEITKNFVVDKFDEIESENPIDRALYTDLMLYMPDQILALSDRISMCHSLEVRVPLADKEVIEHCVKIDSNLKLRGKKSKYLLKKIAAAVLPESIIKHRKQGFEPPMAGWLKNELRDLLENTLSRQNLEKHNYFNYDYVRELISDHVSGKRKNNKILFSLLMFQLWYKKYESSLLSR
jgi:asparagine synthase (glutamine-hydrolysing)